AVDGLLGEGDLHRLPDLVGEGRQPYPHLVRLPPGTLHSGGDLPRGHPQRQHLPGAGVGAAPGEPATQGERLQHGQEPFGPPGTADGAAGAAGLEAALHPKGPGARREPAYAPPPGVGSLVSVVAHSTTAPSSSVSSDRSWDVVRSVSHSSPVPTLFAPRPRLSRIMAATFSSTVPAQTSLRTCTARRWPIRNARSVAWSSTAGFHQRSTWITWLAAVRVSPVPPALRESTNRAGAPGPPAWNRSTSASRSALRTPPCRYATSRPNRAERCPRSIAPNSAYWVNSSARSPAASTSSRISSNRASLPDRPASRLPSLSNWAGWLQTCLSLVMVASTSPRRSIPSLDSIRASMSSTTAWYSEACSAVRLHRTSISSFSGRSEMIERSVFTRRSRNGRVSRASRRAAASSPWRSTGSAYRFLNVAAGPSSPGLANSMMDHRSARRFSTGVPVTATRCRAGSARTAVACRVAAFLIACASSTTIRCHSIS